MLARLGRRDRWDRHNRRNEQDAEHGDEQAHSRFTETRHGSSVLALHERNRRIDATYDAEDQPDQQQQLDQLDVLGLHPGAAALVDGVEAAGEQAQGSKDEEGDADVLEHGGADVDIGIGGVIERRELETGSEGAGEREDDQKEPAGGAPEAVADGEEDGYEEGGDVDGDFGGCDAVAIGKTHCGSLRVEFRRRSLCAGVRKVKKDSNTEALPERSDSLQAWDVNNSDEKRRN
jgi:hypothetical protein